MKFKLDFLKMKNMVSKSGSNSNQDSKKSSGREGRPQSKKTLIIVSSLITVPILGFYLYSEFGSEMFPANSSSDSLSLAPDVIQNKPIPPATDRHNTRQSVNRQQLTPNRVDRNVRRNSRTADSGRHNSTDRQNSSIANHNRNQNRNQTISLANSSRQNSNLHIDKTKSLNIEKSSSVAINPLEDKKEQKLIQTIEKEVLSDNTGLNNVKDPLATVDESIIKNREYSIYLDKKLENLRKLAEYYKRMNKLRELFNLYKQAYSGGSQQQRREDRDQLKVIEMAVKNSVSPLVSKIDYIQRRLSDIEQKRSRGSDGSDREVVGSSKEFENFSNTIKSALVYTMDGEYIVVLKFNGKDIVLRRGDTIAGYKIDSIEDSSVVFKRGNKLYYYTVSNSISDYKINKIKLASSRITFVQSGGKNYSKRTVREYNSPMSPREKAKRELENRLRRF